MLKNETSTNSAQASSAAIKGSVQKIGLVCQMISGMRVEEALLQLKFCKKRVSQEIYKVLYSAISNAEFNHGMNIDKLYVSKYNLGKAFAFKRFHARGRGRASRITKPYSKLTLIVSERE
jgi:large subunit ribosomal protein L22